MLCFPCLAGYFLAEGFRLLLSRVLVPVQHKHEQSRADAICNAAFTTLSKGGVAPNEFCLGIGQVSSWRLHLSVIAAYRKDSEHRCLSVTIKDSVILARPMRRPVDA